MTVVITAEQLKQVDESLKVIKFTRAEIARAKLAKIDMGDKEARLDDAEVKLLAIRQAYGSQTKTRTG